MKRPPFLLVSCYLKLICFFVPLADKNYSDALKTYNDTFK